MANTNTDSEHFKELVALFGEMHGLDMHGVLVYIEQNPVPPAGPSPTAAAIASDGEPAPNT